MQLTIIATLLASAMTLSPVSATALPAPDALSPSLEESNALLPRAPRTSNFCTGSSTGSSSGAYACVNVTWYDSKTRADVKLTVDDSRGDSHSSYGWYRVYFAGDRHEDSPRLEDSRGYAATPGLADRVRRYEKSGIQVTGVRVYACVDVQGGRDVCTDKFVQRPF